MRQWDCGLVVVHGGASVGLEIKLGELDLGFYRSLAPKC
jgi:hypothetical protein